jgi:hypothetical protein
MQEKRQPAVELSDSAISWPSWLLLLLLLLRLRPEQRLQLRNIGQELCSLLVLPHRSKMTSPMWLSWLAREICCIVSQWPQSLSGLAKVRQTPGNQSGHGAAITQCSSGRKVPSALRFAAVVLVDSGAGQPPIPIGCWQDSGTHSMNESFCRASSQKLCNAAGALVIYCSSCITRAMEHSNTVAGSLVARMAWKSPPNPAEMRFGASRHVSFSPLPLEKAMAQTGQLFPKPPPC